MSNLSALLSLPYIQPAQAQKHVTHNEALRILDALVMLSVASRVLTAPPASPAEGERHIVAAPATGAWAGQEDTVAVHEAGGWLFLAPQPGWRAFVADEGADVRWQGGAWMLAGIPAGTEVLGINTAGDSVNRLAVSAPATLLTHEGAGHQLKLNKAAPGDTASLLYQTNWSGRAEMGLAGGDAWSIKVSPDGAAWTEALAIDPVTGHATGAAVQSGPTDVTPGRLARADHAYGPGNLLGTVTQGGGVPTGAVLERGDGASGGYLRLADGTQICWHVLTTATGADVGWTYPAAFAAAPAVTATAQSGAAHLAATQAPTATAVDLSVWNLSGARVAVSAGLLAVGRWV